MSHAEDSTPGRVRHEIDADLMLATGEHPLGKVRRCAGELQPGESVRITSGFRPAPLIEALSHAGFTVSSEEAAPGRHVTYVARSA
ncbi:MAG TPA: DUF2249 domain-containing protein [Bryobacteraceae bacterium]|nr:DUF2249 domain-containing protein [Bryobacteraceae bacterium]